MRVGREGLRRCPSRSLHFRIGILKGLDDCVAQTFFLVILVEHGIYRSTQLLT